jgi:HK97 family phage major capsid protein
VAVAVQRQAGLVAITSELAADSSPAAAQVVGEGLVRDLARKLDSAYFGSTVTNGPSGLLSIASTSVDAGDAWADLDAFEEAKSVAEQHNTIVDAFVCSPATAVTLATLKQFTTAGSNVALLQNDPTAPASRVIGGVPLLTSPAIADNVVWSIPQNRVLVAMRQDASVVTDTSVFFGSDRVAVRATIRLSWGFTDPAAVAKIAPTP